MKLEEIEYRIAGAHIVKGPSAGAGEAYRGRRMVGDLPHSLAFVLLATKLATASFILQRVNDGCKLALNYLLLRL